MVGVKMIKCHDCDRVFSELDVVVKDYYESRGEYWGMPCSEHILEWHCPFCNSEDLDHYTEEE